MHMRMLCDELAALVLASCLGGCAATTEGTQALDASCEHEDEGAPAAGESGASAGSGGSSAGDGPVTVGCRREPLVLGEVSDVELVSPQVVWTGRHFAVGWTAADGYQIKITNGHSISNSKTVASTPAALGPLQPQLFWSSDRLELYYALSESIVVDAFDAGLALVETRMIGFGRFRAVPVSANQVVVISDSALYLDGVETRKGYSGASAAGWNGDSLLVSNVLGHGEWSLSAFALDASPRMVELGAGNWCGVCGTTGFAGGSFFASSASARRHALVVAADRSLTLAIEGLPVLERELPAQNVDASLLWDGARYVVLLADHATDDGPRDIGLVAVTLDGEQPPKDHPRIAISADVADERFPVGAAAAPGDYGIAWARGNELVFQRCALTQH
jgi:hypothetical protein